MNIHNTHPEQSANFQTIALEVMADKAFRSDSQRVNEMIRRGVPLSVDFVLLLHQARTNARS